ncbi:MAG: PKD domain-containing protein [Bacteroidales bacterium]|nr:PKD domain-containing protein [Bacteroidales bacterium]
MKNKILLVMLLTIVAVGVQARFMRLSAQPSVDFTSDGVCVNSPTFFTVDTAVTNVNTIAIWNWDFGDGTFSNIQDPTNTYAGIGTYTVILTVTDTAGVVGSATHFVTIQPLPIANFAYNTPNCQNEPIQFQDLSSTLFGYITTWIWNFGDGSPIDTVLFPDDPNLTHLFPTFGTFNVSLTVINSDSCTNSVSLPVVVTPGPIANFQFTGSCEDQVVQFTDASFANGAGNIVAWDWDFGDPTSGVNNLSNLTDPIHTFADPGTYTVRLIVTNFNNCRDTMIKQVPVYPHPPVDFIYSTACLNELVYFDPDTVVTNINAIGSWSWNFGDGGFSNARNTAHAYIAPGTYTVILTVTDTAGCQNVVSHDVTINPLPVAHFDAGINNCAGASVTFNELTSTIVGYVVKWEWDFGDGNTQTVFHPNNPNVTHTYATPGNYNVTLTIQASDSCTDFESQIITIHPNPVANFDYTSACDGEPVDFTDLSQNNGGGSLVLWNWNFGDPASGVSNFSTLQGPSHQFTTTGTFTVQLIVATSNGCSDTITRQVIVKGKPAIDFTTQNNCQNNAVLFEPNPLVMSTGAIATWSWVFGDGGSSVIQSPTHVYTTSGTFFVTLTVVDTAGCTNTITKPVAIVPQPVSNFNYSQPACKDASVQFTSQAFAPVGYIVKWTWDFGDGNTQVVNFPATPNVSHTFANYGTFNVILTVKTNDSCTHFISKPVTIAPNPQANFSFLTTCMNSPVQFSDLSQSGSGGLSDWSWNFGDPPSGSSNLSTLQNPSHSFSAPLTYNVTLIVTNSGGCKDTVTKPVIVHALPTVDFSSTPGCVNDSTQFISSTFINAAAVVSLLWDFGDGFTSTEDDPYHIYANSGAFIVTLTVTDTADCVNSISHVVSITPPPDAFFQASAPTCANNPVFFEDLSSLSSGQFTSWFWDFGDGNDTLINAPGNPDISHIYITAGNYNVTLKVTTSQGCEDEFPFSITISTSPLSDFEFENTCANSPVNFSSLATPNGGTSIIGHLWDFGDPTSGANNFSNLQNPSHIYANPGNYTVLLEVTNADGCPDTISHVITILPKPPVDFSWLNTCLGTTTEFTVNTSVTNIAAVQDFDWDFGDGTTHSTQQDPTHNYAAAGSYNVVLTITDTAGCVNYRSYAVSINPQPSALFSFTSGCLNTPVQFTDESFTASGENITSWFWDFGVTTASNDTTSIQNPSWTYAALGVYTVSLIVTTENGCQDTVQTAVQVFGLPTAGFTYTAAPCNNGAVYFQDSSISQQATITGWYWEFEPGQFSTLQNPVHVFYSADSCYDVRLIVTDIRGCVDTVLNQVCVPAALTATFSVSPTCHLDTTYFSPILLTPPGDSLVFFNWNFGDPSSGINNTSTLRAPSHYYSLPGTYTVIMQATDINNCPVTKNQYVVVHPLPVPQFTSIGGLCDSIITFNETSSGSGSPISRWIWNYGDGIIDTVNAPSNPDVFHKYPSPGMYQVELTVINNNSCSQFITDSVLVKPCIEAIFELVDTLICQYQILSFADSSLCGLPINQWYWDFGDGTTSSYSSYVNPVVHSYDEPGTYIVKMVVTTTLAGKSIGDSTTLTVVVNPSPLAEFTMERNCFGVPADFTNITNTNGVPISGYRWTFGDPSSTTEDTTSIKNPSHEFTAPGLYTIQLISSNILGCEDTVTRDLQVHPLPDAKFENSLACAGDATEFMDRSDSAVAPISVWNWTFSGEDGLLGYRDDQNTSFTFITPGDYLVNLQVIDTNGCIDTVNKPLVVNPIPTSIFAFNENFNNIQGQLQFENSSMDAIKYYWEFGNGETSFAENPVVFYQDDGTYTIMLVSWNELNCTDTTRLSYEFMVKGLYIPNAFSPNNPQESVQLFKPVGINIETYRIEVFDRWGNMLWYSEKVDDFGRPTEGWNGKFNGTIVQEGVYTWKASAVFKDGTIWNAENVGTVEPLPATVFGTVTVVK